MATETKTFEYVVRDRGGNVVTGRIDAPTEAAVASRLTSLGYSPLSVSEVAQTGLQREINLPGANKVKLQDIAVMSRQMATMISAGLSLLRTLTILAQQTESEALAKIVAVVRNDVEAGSSLSNALAKHPLIFPPIMINMVRAGEVGGFLETSLLSIADNFEAEVKLRATIKSAMTYPVVVFFMAILATVGMLLFIVPIFEDMFADLGGELPAATQVLVVLSGWMKWLAPIMLIGAIIFALWWSRHRNDRKVREFVDPFKLKVPIFGNLFQKIAISRFSRNLGTMVRSGVPILQALEIVGQTAGNVVVERAIADVRDSVRTGESIAGPLSQHEIFPPMVVQMLGVGENSGSLDTMLEKISDFYDAEVEATTSQLTSLIEPLMIAVIGAIVGGMLIALYMPIFSVFDLIE